MADNPNKQEFFPNLNETHIKGFAHQVVKRFSDIPIIEVCLYHYANVYFPDKVMPIKYAMVFRLEAKDYYPIDGITVKMFLDKIRHPFSKTLGEYSTVKDNETFHKLTGGRSFSMLYQEAGAPDNPLMEWRFIALFDGQEPPPGVLVDDPRWILYQKGDLNLQRLIEKVKPEIELLYQAIKVEVGFSGRDADENPIETRRDAALRCFNENKKKFRFMTKDLLKNRDTYSSRYNKHSYDIKMQLLQKFMLANGFKRQGKEELWPQYQRP